MDTKALSKKALKAIEKEESIERLLKLFDGDKNPVIYTVLRGVSSSGMSRDISLVYIKNNDPYYITYSVACALGDRLVSRNGHDAIRVSGCGMDMGFHLVYNLSITLYCADKYEHESAYKLKHRWL